MRLSEEKIAHLAGRVVDRLWDDDMIDFKMQESRFRADMERVIFEDLKIEDEISNEAIERIETYKRDIPYGSDEWKILYERFFDEIAVRRGYTL
jgi:hypothetical protein